MSEFERRHDAYEAFFEVLVRVVPAVLDSLRDDVLPLYTAACDDWVQCLATESASVAFDELMFGELSLAGVRVKYGEGARRKMHFRYRVRFGLLRHEFREPTGGYFDQLGLAVGREPFSQTEAALKEAILVWAVRWHLTTDRAVTWACDLLHRWDFNGYCLPHSSYSGGFFAEADLENLVQPFVFEHQGWQPAASTRAEAEAVMLEAFKTQLKAHHDRTEAAAEAVTGIVRAAEYRSLLKHLEWLVRYQVLEEEWPEVAATATRKLADGRQVRVTQQAVEGAVKKAADLLGLALREGRGPGRPPGSINDPNRGSAGRVT